MKMNTPETEELKLLVEKQYGRVLSTTTDFEEFSLQVKKQTGKSLSASTLKRLWNYVGDSHTPRICTLDILSLYIGYKDYATFKSWLKTSVKYNSSFFHADQITSSELEPDTQVEIGWIPNRMLQLRYLGESTYEVASSQNSKLQCGDRFVAGCFIKSYPLYLPYVERNGLRTAPFVAGRNGGLTILSALKAKK